jgi:tetratricopeptide (TPR) repeat protein
MYYDTVGDFQSALLVVETYFESDPVRFRRVKADKARLLYKMRDFERAEAAAVEVLNIEFSSEMAYYVMLSRLAAADFANAVKYAQLIKENKDSTDKEPYYAAYYYEALAYMKAGDTERATPAFEEAQRVLRMATIENPGRMNLYIYRALCYKAVNDNERALEMADYVINLTKGEFKEAYYIRGMVYQDMGENEKAQADFAIVTNSGSPLQNFVM